MIPALCLVLCVVNLVFYSCLINRIFFPFCSSDVLIFVLCMEFCAFSFPAFTAVVMLLDTTSLAAYIPYTSVSKWLHDTYIYCVL